LVALCLTGEAVETKAAFESPRAAAKWGGSKEKVEVQRMYAVSCVLEPEAVLKPGAKALHLFLEKPSSNTPFP
jgi:hypothetical protein